MTGLICLDKPEGMTSFAALSRMKRIVGEKKAGHAGTLDPFATGVLPVAFGGCTRFLELFPSHDKAYTACIRLGIRTDTGDLTGSVTEEKDFSYVKAEDFEKALEPFRGQIRQVPPMMSSVKKDGVRLYTLARQGIEVEREERTVTIHRLVLLHADEKAGEYTVDVHCSAGTYIRSLAFDIGAALGCGAAVKTLRRTAALGFTLADSVTLERLQQVKEEGKLSGLLLPIDRALGYERLSVTEKQATRFHNGGELSLDRLRQNIGGRVCVYAPNGDFLGVGAPDGDFLRPIKIYVGDCRGELRSPECVSGDGSQHR